MGRANSTRFFIFASVTIIGWKLGWFAETTAIIVMLGLGFLNVIMTIEDITKKNKGG